MFKVELLHYQPMQAIDLKQRLIADGLVQDKDFCWSYSPARYDNDGFTAVTPRSVVFEFADPSLATFYKLKWVNG